MTLARSVTMREILIFVVLLTTMGCAPVSPNRFAVKEPMPERLPVRLEVDAKSFAMNTGAHRLGEEVAAELAQSWARMHPGDKIDTAAVIRSNVYADPRQNKEMMAYLQSELERNAVDPTADGAGVAVCRLMYRDSHRGARSWFFFFSSIGTLFVPTLLGYPIGSTTTDLELELAIRDNTGAPVAAYKASGTGTGYSAMYWGYSMRDASLPYAYGAAPRASYLEALRVAVRSLIEQLQRDSGAIRSRLTG